MLPYSSHTYVPEYVRPWGLSGVLDVDSRAGGVPLKALVNAHTHFRVSVIDGLHPACLSIDGDLHGLCPCGHVWGREGVRGGGRGEGWTWRVIRREEERGWESLFRAWIDKIPKYTLHLKWGHHSNQDTWVTTLIRTPKSYHCNQDTWVWVLYHSNQDTWVWVLPL